MCALIVGVMWKIIKRLLRTRKGTNMNTACRSWLASLAAYFCFILIMIFFSPQRFSFFFITWCMQEHICISQECRVYNNLYCIDIVVYIFFIVYIVQIKYIASSLILWNTIWRCCIIKKTWPFGFIILELLSRMQCKCRPHLVQYDDRCFFFYLRLSICIN